MLSESRWSVPGTKCKLTVTSNRICDAVECMNAERGQAMWDRVETDGEMGLGIPCRE